MLFFLLLCIFSASLTALLKDLHDRLRMTGWIPRRILDIWRSASGRMSSLPLLIVSSSHQKGTRLVCSKLLSSSSPSLPLSSAVSLSSLSLSVWLPWQVAIATDDWYTSTTPFTGKSSSISSSGREVYRVTSSMSDVSLLHMLCWRRERIERSRWWPVANAPCFGWNKDSLPVRCSPPTPLANLEEEAGTLCFPFFRGLNRCAFSHGSPAFSGISILPPRESANSMQSVGSIFFFFLPFLESLLEFLFRLDPNFENLVGEPGTSLQLEATPPHPVDRSSWSSENPRNTSYLEREEKWRDCKRRATSRSKSSEKQSVSSSSLPRRCRREFRLPPGRGLRRLLITRGVIRWKTL